MKLPHIYQFKLFLYLTNLSWNTRKEDSFIFSVGTNGKNLSKTEQCTPGEHISPSHEGDLYTALSKFGLVKYPHTRNTPMLKFVWRRTEYWNCTVNLTAEINYWLVTRKGSINTRVCGARGLLTGGRGEAILSELIRLHWLMLNNELLHACVSNEMKSNTCARALKEQHNTLFCPLGQTVLVLCNIKSRM